jgi:excinuclease ABC subunit A
METIRIRGARTHNLKNINLDLPRDQLIVITGLSGSGKSSLAFDTLYAEGQRRYVESLSAYARQFLQLMEKPDVDLIEGLSPAISIEQKATSHNPRSTVGTVTEIHDYLRLLFARAGTPYCPEHNQPLEAQTVSQMVDQRAGPARRNQADDPRPGGGQSQGRAGRSVRRIARPGFCPGPGRWQVYEIDAVPKLNKSQKHNVDVVVDRLKVRDDMRQRLAESFETALRHAEGRAIALEMDSGKEHMFSAKFACPVCSYALQELEPRLFSFNNPMGACPKCDGLGVIQFFDPKRVVTNPAAVAGQRGDSRLGQEEPVLFPDHRIARRALRFLGRHRVERAAEEVRTLILYGSGRTEIAFRYLNEKGTRFDRNHTFEGIIPNLERRYRGSDSKAALGEARNYFNCLTLTGAKAQVADKILKEITSRISFLINVGLDYLCLERSAETLSGGERSASGSLRRSVPGLTGVMYVLDEPSIGLHQRQRQRPPVANPESAPAPASNLAQGTPAEVTAKTTPCMPLPPATFTAPPPSRRRTRRSSASICSTR